MDTGGDNVQHQDVGGDVRRRRSRRTAARSLVTIVGLVLLPLVSVPALATTTTLPGAGTGTGAGIGTVDAPQPSRTQPPVYSNPVPAPAPGAGDASSPVPTNTPTPPSGGTPTAPTIVDPGDITTALARFAGRATPGHQVRVAEPAVPSASVCRATATPGGTWSCVGTVRSGPAQVFTVLDTTASALPNADAAPSDVIVPPTIDARRPTTGTVTGTGHPGATVTVARAGSSAALTAVVTAAGTWSARWGTGPGAPAEGSVSVSATQTASTVTGYRSDLRSAASAARTLVVDRTAPAAPRITAPAGSAAGSAQRVRIAGTAEPRTVVTAYVDSTAVCRASVAADGSWSCRAADSLRAGSHMARAVAQDEAGNTSSAATAVVFRVSRGASVAPAASSPGTTPGSGGGADGGGPHGSGTGPAHGSGSGTTHGSGIGTPGTGSSDDGTSGSALPGGGAGGSGSHGGRPDWTGPAGDWTVATGYDHAVPTIQSASSWRTLAVAAGVAAVFLLLVAGPVRVLAGALRERVPLRAARFTGRNRTRSERRHGDDAVASWVTITLGIAVAGVLTLLGTGIALEARYVRLAIGVVAGVAVLSAVVVLATRWTAGEDRHTVTYRLSPGLLLAAVLASGLTRAADLSPALVVGVLLVPVARTDVGTAAMHLGRGLAACARSATWRSVALLVLAVVGWVLHSVTPASGFAGSLVSEFASTLCVGGLGSLVVTLLPLRGTAGAALASVSRPRYAALTAVGVGLAAAVYSGTAGTHVPVGAMATGVGVVLVAAAAAWAWLRFAGAGIRS
ncbi:hypothetical protein DEJ33_08650 [Curtobacterium sp. MCPF17_047]|uniref:Ig-like domain-containing protein n=1 Tax=unclassified Curtobacterium TaxID=257496 RepID=UPI000DAA171D|nr:MULTISPECIES: Ig-like domain-containing protein [unclassified Curtobacterium]PZE55297.1 hypothetical protein DEJ24_14790 [Curtobacterium sp. MCPF17_001]PZF65806.1 hypothetical protein DEJ33_08650 [Curtobacterium sp. MCPF17_047]